MILPTKHFIQRVDERYITNKTNKLEYIIGTFNSLYKKYKKKKININIKKEYRNNNIRFIIYYYDFKYVYTEEKDDIVLISFWIRKKYWT